MSHAQRFEPTGKKESHRSPPKLSNCRGVIVGTMETKKLRVGILFGGKSAEHEVSLQSAKNVADAIDKEKFDVSLIAIDKTGKWLLPNQAEFLLNAGDPKTIALNTAGNESVALVPQSQGEVTSLSDSGALPPIDVVFPILHGPFGEDGTVQGLLKLAGVPFVGASVLGSAVGMDKDVMKRLLRDADLPIAKFKVLHHGEDVDFGAVSAELGLPLFIKPANLGSSVGVSKAKNKEEFEEAVAHAFEFDTKIIVEEFIAGRELECAVLGNQNPDASGVGEIIPHHEFYSYDAKYIDEDGASLVIPADIPPEATERLRALAVLVFKTLACEGLARVDFFYTKEGALFVNEINTMPGFTNVSMYPRLWGAAGLSYTDLITRLIELGVERFRREQKLKTAR